MQPQTIKASAFKTKCLELMDEVNETGQEVIITKNGKPAGKLVLCWFSVNRNFALRFIVGTRTI